MKVRFLGKFDTLALIKGKIYDVMSVEMGWYRIMTELDEDYLFPPDQFDVVLDSGEDMIQENNIQLWNLSIGTVAVFLNLADIPKDGMFEFVGQRYKIKHSLMLSGTADLTSASFLVEMV